MKTNIRTIKWIAQITAAAILMYLAFKRVEAERLYEVLKGMSLYPLMFVPILMSIDLVLNSYRIKSLYDFYDVDVKLSSVISIKIHGLFFSLFFPLLGDAYKILAFKELYNTSYGKNTLVVFLDRLIFTFALSIILLPVWLFSVIKVIPILQLSVALLLPIEIFMLYLLNSPQLIELARKFLSTLKIKSQIFAVPLTKRQGYLHTITTNSLVALVRHFFAGLLYLTLAYSIMHGIKFNVVLFMFCVFSIALARVLPVSAGGVGLREYIAVAIFPQIGISAETGFSIAFVMSSLYILQGIVGGIWFLIYKLKGV